jgi:hypothetical protein
MNKPVLVDILVETELDTSTTSKPANVRLLTPVVAEPASNGRTELTYTGPSS